MQAVCSGLCDMCAGAWVVGQTVAPLPQQLAAHNKQSWLCRTCKRCVWCHLLCAAACSIATHCLQMLPAPGKALCICCHCPHRSCCWLVWLDPLGQRDGCMAWLLGPPVLCAAGSEVGQARFTGEAAKPCARRAANGLTGPRLRFFSGQLQKCPRSAALNVDVLPIPGSFAWQSLPNPTSCGPEKQTRTIAA